MACEPCPTGATCSRSGLTIDMLTIQHGYWRLSNTTADVRLCPDHSTVALWRSKPTGCRGGEGAGEALCRPGLGGIYCMACSAALAETHYYHNVEKECLECAETIPGVVWLLVSVLVLGLVVLLLRRHAGVTLRGRISSLHQALGRSLKALQELRASALWASLAVMARSLIGFYQIVSEVEEVFVIQLPLKVVQLIKSFSWLDLHLTNLVQLDCNGLGGYTTNLLMNAVMPVLLLLLTVLVAFACEAALTLNRGRELLRGAALRALPWMLFITFLVSTDICAYAFRAFRCECFGDESWLRADYSMQCTTNGCSDDAEATMTPEWLAARQTAWTVLWVYAMGVPCAYAVLLFHERNIIVAEEVAPLAGALAFLHDGYRPTCFWWELINVLRKLLTVGFATLIMPGSMDQLVIVLMLVLGFLMLQLRVKPYRAMDVALLAIVEEMSLMMFVVLCIIVKAEHILLQSPDEVAERTARLHTQFFYDTEVIANTMVGSLVVSVSVAAAFGLRRAGPIVLRGWQVAFASNMDYVSNRGPSAAERQKATRVAARAKFHAALQARAVVLEVPELILEEEADLNPVLVGEMEEAKAEVRLDKARQLATGQASTKRRRLDGALRKLKIEVAEAKQEDQRAARFHALQLYLKKRRGVRQLVKEGMAPDEVEWQRRRMMKVSRKGPAVDPHEVRQLHEREAFRSGLESRGWVSAEAILPDEQELIDRFRLREEREAQQAQLEALARRTGARPSTMLRESACAASEAAPPTQSNEIVMAEGSGRGLESVSIGEKMRHSLGSQREGAPTGRKAIERQRRASIQAAERSLVELSKTNQVCGARSKCYIRCHHSAAPSQPCCLAKARFHTPRCCLASHPGGVLVPSPAASHPFSSASDSQARTVQAARHHVCGLGDHRQSPWPAQPTTGDSQSSELPQSELWRAVILPRPSGCQSLRCQMWACAWITPSMAPAPSWSTWRTAVLASTLTMASRSGVFPAPGSPAQAPRYPRPS